MWSRLVCFLIMAVASFAATNSLAIYDDAATSHTNRPESISRFFTVGQIANYPRPVINGTPAAVWQSDCKTRWPADDSAWHCIVSFTHSLTSGGSNTITFTNSSEPCSSGGQAACDAAGLDEAEMLAFNGGAWGAVTSIAANGATTRTASARTCIDDGNYTYWQRGPVATVVTCESNMPDRSYDIGYTCTANCTGNYSSATWSDDQTNKPLHPWWRLWFYTGWSGVRIDYGVQNAWTSRLKDQRITLNLYSNSSGSTLEYGPHTFTVYAKTSARKGRIWDGTTPGAVRYDMNREWLETVGVVPAYDSSISVPAATANSEASTIAGNINADAPLVCTTSTTCGGYRYAMPNASGYPERPWLARWFVRLLYTWHSGIWDNMLVQGDITGTLPLHLRDDVGGANEYIAGTNALNYPVSLNARPTYSTTVTNPGPQGDDFITPLATLSTSYNWAASGGTSLSHFPSFAYLPYVLTGDPYYLEEQLYISTYWEMAGNWGISNFSRAREAGLPGGLETRADAWRAREVGNAAFLAPDGWPQKIYFTTQAQRHIDFQKGRLNIQDGTGYTSCCTTNPHDADIDRNAWAYGRWSRRWRVVPTGFAYPSLEMESLAFCEESLINTTIISGCTSPWMTNFNLFAWGMIRRQGLLTEIDTLLTTGGLHLVQLINHPDSNPYLVEEYREPTAKIQASGVTLTQSITSSSTTLNVSSVPAFFTNDIVVTIDSENFRICSFDGGALTATVCGTGTDTNVGRGYYSTSRTAHSPGASVNLYGNRLVLASWAEWLSGWEVASQNKSALVLYEYVYIAQAALAHAVEAGITGAQTAWDWLYARVPRDGNSAIVGFFHVPAEAGQEEPDPPVITTSSLPNGTVGAAYSQTVVATGGTTPYVFTISSGTMCSSLSLATSGVISGTPSNAQTCNFTVLVTDDAALTDTQALSITINSPPASGERGSVGAGVQVGSGVVVR